MNLILGLFAALLFPGLAAAAGLSCPAGMPLGAFDLTVHREPGNPGIPLSKINRLEEGDQVIYTPVLKPKEKRPGQVALVLLASEMSVLPPHDADKKATWKIPFRSALVLYVYGPNGLSTGKLRGFLEKDNELVAQLADYAEKTEHTETVLQALAAYESTGAGEGLQAALSGFAGQFGSANKLDRTAPLDQQTLAAFRTLNPALSAYDPISPAGTQRLAQTAGLATTVAAMFFGSTVGLAAGGTAMALNLKTLMFPDTDFRSAYTQQVEAKPGQTLCSAREQIQNRKRRAYLWALRIPDVNAPAVKVGAENNVVAGQRTPLKLEVAEADRKRLPRFRQWALESSTGNRVPVPVTPAPDGSGLQLNLKDASVEPGSYKLTGLWDWSPVTAVGDVAVEALPSFATAHLNPASAVKLQEHSGKQVVTLEGSDFQFIEKVTMVRTGDKYATPVTIPWSLPEGPRRGPQRTLEMQVDTSQLNAGPYTLALAQQGGSVQNVQVQVVMPPPVISNLPLVLNCGENQLTLAGSGLDRITGLESAGLKFSVEPGGKVVVTVPKDKTGTADLLVSVRDYPAPIALAGAVMFAGARPKITAVEPSIPSGLPIALRQGELLAGVYTNLLLRVSVDSPVTAVTLRCSGGRGDSVTVRPGESEERVRMQSVQDGTVFLSIDAGRWQSPCRLMATVATKESGQSNSAEIGSVVRMPTIDSFRLTEETAGEGLYVGVLQGRDLELIEKTGWDANNGQLVQGLPSAIVGEGNKQSLRVVLPWPSPAPHAPLYIWLRGESEGRATTVRY